MSEEIIKKIEKKGYKEDKELALNIYNELKTSLRHRENIIIALPSIFATLFTLLKILEIKIESTIIFFGFLGLLIGIRSIYYYSKEEKLLKKLTNIIIEDPMDKEDIEVLKELLVDPLIWYSIAMWILVFIIILS
jgi:hypothetical protein